MEKLTKLKDGTDVTIREMEKGDLDKSIAFFQTLTDEDRAYFRIDVLNPANIYKRFESMLTGKVKRVIAEVDKKIVADGALELDNQEWKEHIGELRLIVSPDYRRKGLGMLMANELYTLAMSENIEELMVKFMRPQAAAMSIFKKLGFHENATLPGYVKDKSGKRQDLLVMRCDIKEMWNELEDYMTHSDWQRVR